MEYGKLMPVKFWDLTGNIVEKMLLLLLILALEGNLTICTVYKCIAI